MTKTPQIFNRRMASKLRKLGVGRKFSIKMGEGLYYRGTVKWDNGLSCTVEGDMQGPVVGKWHFDHFGTRDGEWEFTKLYSKIDWAPIVKFQAEIDKFNADMDAHCSKTGENVDELYDQLHALEGDE